jgi:hypothetical protein
MHMLVSVVTSRACTPLVVVNIMVLLGWRTTSVLVASVRVLTAGCHWIEESFGVLLEIGCATWVMWGCNAHVNQTMRPNHVTQQ